MENVERIQNAFGDLLGNEDEESPATQPVSVYD